MSRFDVLLIVILQVSSTWHWAHSVNSTGLDVTEIRLEKPSTKRIEDVTTTKTSASVKQTEATVKASGPSTAGRKAPKWMTLSPTEQTPSTVVRTTEPVSTSRTTTKSQVETSTSVSDRKREGQRRTGKKDTDSTDGTQGGIKLYKDKPVNKTEPKIMEIMTKITDSAGEITDDTVYGPRIEGIEARFEPMKHVIPLKLKEKLDALSCEVSPLPSESTLWNGNETRDLSLPIKVRLHSGTITFTFAFALSL
ncbi:hypothetical protein RUM43_012461 [Polyplax serrata]|uniref:Uncharacterized protein n=1 Tax=Polyplax serrata TaxID=468196 RepID=A0AAN8NRP3_POLSC